MAIPAQQLHETANPITILAAQVLEARDLVDELEEKLKEAKARKEELEAKLVEQMAMDEMEKFSYGGKTFSTSVELYASIRADSKEEALEWLKDNGYGDLISEQVHSKRLASLVKEMRENEELPEEFESMLHIFEKPRLNVRKGR